MWGTAEGGSGTLFITVLLLDEMRTSWMYYGRVQAFCNALLVEISGAEPLLFVCLKDSQKFLEKAKDQPYGWSWWR